MSTHKPAGRRRYRLQARAERQHQTRSRIVDAVVALHQDVGPARTTIADIARRAGVQRLTVYNTFPDVADLFAACQGRFLEAHPLPNLAPQPRGSALAGFERALVALYAWYRGVEAMERHVHRDRHLVPALDERMSKTADVGLAAAADAHATAIARTPQSAVVRALVQLAFEFSTWDVLTRQGLSDVESARAMRQAVAAARRDAR